MPEDLNKTINGTIDDYLLALADGIVKAQDELNTISVQTSSGQSPVQYQLPRLDFELKMSFSLEREAESTPTSTAPSPSRRMFNTKGRAIPLLKATPVNPETTSEHFSAEAVSTIKGSFIAVPLNGGKPPNILGLTLLKHEKTQAEIQVSLGNSLGETLPNQAIAMGIDRAFSKSLNEERGLPVAKQELKPTTDFIQSEVTTNNDGIAIATLNIAAQEAANVSIVIEATVGNLSESLIIHQA